MLRDAAVLEHFGRISRDSLRAHTMVWAVRREHLG